ncbi:WG repeat-containing protein [Paenibacillus sp. JDR-2]|uniref:WG repeat-containing protein n=1 Tax=Paenibacillus sp. (strain JDR-2) TaxID=324057 RepID=UPI000166A58B|nr:WG repeat-containing protein [Paenibacillus sp. JDR-2]ACT00279.1 KWG Leptospira repeat protein [Paenibacillus sp. JDR-2]
MTNRQIKQPVVWVSFAIVFIVAAIFVVIQAETKKNSEETILYPVQVDGKWGYINKAGKIAIEPIYTLAEDFHEGVAVVQVKDESKSSEDGEEQNNVKVGVIDSAGKMIVKPEYSAISTFSDGVAGAIKLDEDTYSLEYFVLNTKGKVVSTLPEDMNIVSMLLIGNNMPTQSDGLILVQDEPTEMYGYINSRGKMIIPYQYEQAYSFSDGLALVMKDKHYQYIDKTGKVIIDASKYVNGNSFSEGLAAVAVKNSETSAALYGYIDTKGNMVIEPKFTIAYGFSEGLAKVCVGGSINQYSIGYIDKSGAYKLGPDLDDSFDETLFSEGLVSINDGAGGYMNKDGNLSIPKVVQKENDNILRHNNAGPFRNGIAKVSFSDGRIGYIDTTGNYIWDPRN